jgi:hypothetical protein
LRDKWNKELAATGESFPYCPAQSECWWGAAFPGQQFGKGYTRFDHAQVKVTGRGKSPPSAGPIVEIQAFRDDRGQVLAVTPGGSGLIYVIVLESGQPRVGASVKIDMAEGTRVGVLDNVPAGKAEALRGFFYSGAAAGAGS